MSPREEAAFHAGVRHAAEQARIAAITLEIRDDASEMRIRAAAAALHALADGLRGAISANVADLPAGVLRTEQSPPSGNHQGFLDGSSGPVDPRNSASVEFRDIPVKPAPDRFPQAEGTSPTREQAIAAGYQGDACTSCQNFTLRRAGTCLACDSCGSTTGCS